MMLLRESYTTARLIPFLIFIAIIPSTALSQSIESLQTHCSKKALVYNRDGTKIGEAPDPYCIGFLEGTFTAMRRANLVCPEEQTDGPLLLSALDTYVNDKKPNGVDAAEATAAAF
jgi:hypothetical protein